MGIMYLTPQDTNPSTGTVSGDLPDAGAPELICDGVRGGDTGYPVTIVCDDETNRLMLRAINEGGFACTDIDLLDFIEWLHRLAPNGVNVDEITRNLITRSDCEWN